MSGVRFWSIRERPFSSFSPLRGFHTARVMEETKSNYLDAFGSRRMMVILSN
jgi:hypothetical protein